MKTMTSFFLATVALIFAMSDVQAGTVRQVYLIQNSGWMEPYYLDPKSQFLALAESLIGATQLENVEITVASFNQDGQLPGQRSPNVLFSGPYAPEAVARQLAGLTVPRRPDGRYADADFLGALEGTITGLLQQQEGVIWMLSNNKNSPGNSQEVASNTRGFYDLLRNSSFVTRMIAFPLRMPVAGPNFSEKGFIVYGIAYGQTAARALDVIAGPGTPLRALFADPPIFLKPTDPQTLELRMQPQEVAEGASIALQNGIVVVDGLDAATASTVSFIGTLVNVAYPKKIQRARVSVSWEGQDPHLGAAQSDPPVVENIPAGAQSPPLRFTLFVPAQPRPPGLAGLAATQTVVDGLLRITLDDLSFDLDDGFVAKASAVFGGEMMGEGQRRFVEAQLPAIFFDFRQERQRVTTIPIRMILHYPVWPLYGAMALGLLAVGCAGAVPFVLLRPRTYTVNLGTESQRIRLRPAQQMELRGADGRRHLVRGRLFGPPAMREPG